MDRRTTLQIDNQHPPRQAALSHRGIEESTEKTDSGFITQCRYLTQGAHMLIGSRNSSQ